MVEYPIKEQTVNVTVIIIIVVLAFAVLISILYFFYGGQFFRRLVCAILFWIPYGALSQAFMQGCTAIPV